jgi:hypothetical protein
MKSIRILASGCLCAVLASSLTLAAGERSAPPRVVSARADGFTEPERRALVFWAMNQPRVRAALAGHRTRLLRVWSEVAKGESGAYRRAVMVMRDYDAGTAREIAVDLSTGTIEMRELVGVQPSREEIEEGMAIARKDPILATFAANPDLALVGGFHNRSRYSDDPCATEVCLELAFMKPNYEGPARYLVVNLTRGLVAHHDFRTRPGEAPSRLTEKN